MTKTKVVFCAMVILFALGIKYYLTPESLEFTPPSDYEQSQTVMASSSQKLNSDIKQNEDLASLPSGYGRAQTEKASSSHMLTSDTKYNENLFNTLIQEIQLKYDNYIKEQLSNADDNSDDPWFRQWPEPKSNLERVFLNLLFRGEKDPSRFDEELEELIGHLEEMYEDDPLTDTLISYLEHSQDEEFLLTRAHIYKYNSRFAVDDRLSEQLLQDLTDIDEGLYLVEPVQARAYFDALVESHDQSAETKYLNATVLLDKASADDQVEMIIFLDENIMSLLPEMP